MNADNGVRLTEEAFWDRYWSTLELPKTIDPNFSFDRCLSRAFLTHVPPGKGGKLIEVGCAPGRWMIFFEKMLGYQVDGIEYVPVAAEKTRENLAMSGVSGEVFQADFFSHTLPLHSYDAVLSLGFIEHFEAAEPVIAKHIELLKPGGVLVLGIPNFRGVNYGLEWLWDRHWLQAHNTDIARLSFFKALSQRFTLEPLWAGYVGGFEPALFTVAEVPEVGTRLAQRVRTKLLRRRRGVFVRTLTLLQRIRNRFVWTDYLNSPWTSSYILGVYRVPNSEIKHEK